MEQSSQSEGINVDSAIRDALDSDFEKIEQMTLLDNEDALFTLYMKHPSFDNRKYLFNLLRNMYKEKYLKLYERYPSLNVWSSFCLGFLISRSETELKTICHIKADNKIFNINFNSAFSVLSRKRSQITAAKEGHPFLNLPFYMEHSAMFELGKLTEHCVPSEFALLFIDARTSRSKIDGVFKRAVIASLQFKANQNISSLYSVLPTRSTYILLMDSVNQLLSQRGNFMLDNDSVSIVAESDAFMENIANENIKIPFVELVDDYKEFYIAPISLFQCTVASANAPEIRYYCERIYELTDNLLKISDKEIAKLEKLNADKKQELMGHIIEFEKTVSN